MSSNGPDNFSGMAEHEMKKLRCTEGKEIPEICNSRIEDSEMDPVYGSKNKELEL